MNHTTPSLLDRLLSVEVDVIVTDRVGARTAPDLRDVRPAVENLAGDYRRWILQRGAALNDDWTELVASGAADAAGAGNVDGLDLDRLRDRRPAQLTDDLEELQRTAELATRMCTVLGANGRLSDPHLPIVLRRIAGNAAQLRAATTAHPCTPEQLAVVRKAAELGTDVILAQTVVQVDGDAIARLDPSIVSGDQRAVARVADLAVDRSLEHWRGLVDLVTVVVTTAGSFRSPIRRLAARGRAVWRRWRARRTRPSTRSDAAATGRLGPRQTWRRLRAGCAELFAGGGVAIESGADGSPYARTVIQPDGDALWFVRLDSLTDERLLDAHAARVSDWYRDTGSAVTSARWYLTNLQRAIGGLAVIVAAGAGRLAGWWWVALVAGAAIVAYGLVRRAVGRLVRRRLGIQA